LLTPGRPDAGVVDVALVDSQFAGDRLPRGGDLVGSQRRGLRADLAASDRGDGGLRALEHATVDDRGTYVGDGRLRGAGGDRRLEVHTTAELDREVESAEQQGGERDQDHDGRRGVPDPPPTDEVERQLTGVEPVPD